MLAASGSFAAAGAFILLTDPDLGPIAGRRIPVGEIPRVTVTIGNLVVQGKRVEVASAEAVYPKGVPDYADAVVEGDRLVITVGKPVEGRTRRSVRLIPGEDRKP